MSAPPESAGTLSRAEKQERLRAMLSARISRTRTAPASFAQERMWLLDRVEGAGAAYVMNAIVRISGPLDAEALGRAVNELVRRHEALRTTIGDEDGAPVQVIAPFIPRKLRVEEVADVDEVRRIATDDATRPFDLAAGPLFRPRLLRLAEDEHVLLMTLHHIIADGWSLGVMRDEVGVLYAAFREDLPSPLPEPTFQYADYATQQRERLRGPVVEKHLAYWRERLADAPALLELPTDHPRPAERTIRGASLRVSVGREVTAPLEALARREGASLHMALLAAFQVLLGRYAGTDDVVVGSPVAGRGREELERLIGFFVNTVALRTDLSGDPDFREVLRRTRATALGAYAHAEIPFERVVAELRRDRSRGHTPVVQVMFSLENAAPGGSSAQAESGLGVHTDTSKFDLTLALESRADGGFKGSLEYSTDLFHEASARRMLARWERLLVQVGQQPDAPLSRLAWMDADERRLVVTEWNRTAAPYPADADLPTLFEAHAAGTPDAPALVFGEARLTYGALNARANRLANHLLRAGAGPESRIGIHLERGADWIVALLATVKAGGAYVPLEPGYPAARLAWMAADAGVSIVVTEDRLRAAFPAPEGVRVVSVDGDAADIASESAENPGRGTGPRGLAHVIYTSGSTGTPKGVGIEQRGIIRLVVESDLALGPADRVAQASTAAFDAATWEVWGTLLNGAALVGIPREAALAPERMEALLRAEGVTVLLLPTALFNQVARERPAAFAGMRAVLFGGEAADADALRAVLRAGPPARLENAYGPTENTTFSTRHTVRDVAPDAVTVPIGRPVANSTAYVLDAALRPVPADLPGELCVGGDGVARGYLGRPALTAERFVPDPFSTEPGARMYRTGDRARWAECVGAEVRECGSGSERNDASRRDAQGHEPTHALTHSRTYALPHSRTHALQFLGRVDGQVKVRGFRIETGEVESAARSFPGVAECVVVAAGEGGERRLVAYVVGGADADGLRAHLRRTLPDYMVPSAFVPLERLPLTPNGKLDRRALPAPGRPAREHVPPRTPTEAAIAVIWAEVLGVDAVGSTDDFFALGGHSLLATRVLSRIRTSLGVEPTVRALFDGSTLAELARTVDGLRRGDDPQRAAIVPVPRTGDLPLSLAQERLWLADQMRPDSPVYNVPAGLRLRGALDPAALERAVAEVVRRHESLRTTFALRDGTRVQVIHPFAGFALPAEDLTGLAEGERDEAVRAAAADAGTQPFDLERGPLVRARLLRLADDDHVLMVVMHHVVTDGWSMGLLFGEVAALYAAFREGRPSPLPELPIQYPDYAVWQRAHVQGEAMAGHRAYWLRRMAGAPALLELPTDHPRAARRADSGAGAGVPLELPAALTARLEALARAEGATLYMVLLAAWQLLLGRYAGADDVVVGSPVAGRTRTETEKLIGFFVNTVVLRTELDGDPSFRALLGRVRTRTLEAYEHQDLPFETLVAALQPPRAPGYSPVFQVMFALQTADTASGELPGLRLEAVPVDNRTAMFDLSLLLAPRRGGVAGMLKYASDLWERATMVRMVGHFVRILEQAAGDADRPISRLDLLDGEERVRLLNQWSGRTAWRPAESTLHALFQAQAARTPDAVALEHEGERWTYARLDARADRLAHRLAAAGVRRGDAVGVCLEWRPELVAALLATLKAGGVYVPLDPSLPAGRLAYMAGDAGVRAVVTRAGLADVPSGAARIDVETEEAPAATAGAPRVGVLPADLAYVIYTSGSTGLPKGVAVEHGAAAAHLSALAGVHGMVAEDRVLQFASAGFDVSLEQVFLPLLTGATLVLRGAVLWSPAEFPERVRDLGITVVNLPPAYWREVAHGAGPDALRGLRLLLVGGDALPADASDARGAGRLVNCYGPTETVITATAFAVEPGAAAGAVVPIGRPLPGRAVYVLDPRGALVPAGVAGELYVGGPLLARGYVGRAAQTAERFVPDPFGREPGARLYRTGDRVRWTHKATDALTHSRTHALEFLGRTDFQVKIRGFRIEPGEIEAALRLHHAVADAAVVARADDGGDPRLVAYVAGAAPDASDAVIDDALRAHLRQSLPEYMVPSVFVRLERLPLTPSGKVDRRALPAPSADAASAGERPRGGRTPVEEVLAAVWEDLLRVEHVAPDDNFFHLGGHSILATTVVARVQETMGVRLSLTSIFQAPTLAELAALVESERRAGAPSLPPVVPVPRDRDLPLSWAQERLFFLDRLQPGLAFYNVPFAVALTGSLNVAALESALSETVRRHEVLRTTFREADGGAPHLHVSPFDGFQLPVDDLSSAADVQAEARRHAADEARRPFDLHEGPLFRARLLRLTDDEHVLLVSMHHAVSDEWSTGVLVRELSAGYAAAREGRPSPLPELPVQYADYTVWQREQLRGAAMEAQLAYWRAQLAGAPALTELPADRPRPALQTHRGASEPFRFPAELLRGLEALGRAEGATLYMVMLGALQVLLARYGGTEDVVVGSPITGRMRHETEGLIGFFANTLVLRTDLSGDPPFREVLRRARQTALGAYDHQDVPFERLVEELQPERSLGHSPLFQVMLLQGAGDPRGLELPGLELRRFGGGLGSSKFDLTLAFVPGADGLGVSMEYATDLFDRATVQRMLGHLGRVLEQVIRDPDVRLAELDLLGADERRLVLDAWNATDAPLPTDGCAHHLIQAQAARTPHAVAVVHGAVSLSYRELNEAANGLAHRLMELGVGPETRVGICLERGPAMVAAVLAVLKAGGAYVPLDPSYPAPRLAFMAADCGMRVLLTQASLRDALPAPEGVRVLDVEALEGGRADDPDSGVGPANLAFVLYTSGSTGTPKGVAMAHDALVNLVGWNWGEPRTTLQFSPISFDVSFQEIAATLSTGGTLVLVDEALRRDPDALLRYMAEQRVERLFLPFVALQALADAAAARVPDAAPG